MLKHQKGNCFDFSTLLCSMLIGAGYDAYCVNGYGSQDLCHMDLMRDVCPLTVKHKEVPGVRAALGIPQDALFLTRCASAPPGPSQPLPAHPGQPPRSSFQPRWVCPWHLEHTAPFSKPLSPLPLSKLTFSYCSARGQLCDCCRVSVLPQSPPGLPVTRD